MVGIPLCAFLAVVLGYAKAMSPMAWNVSHVLMAALGAGTPLILPWNDFRLNTVMGGDQLYSQPVLSILEGWISKRFLHTDFVNKIYKLKPPLLPAIQLNPFRLCFRSAYVVTTIGIALLFPYFNSVLGILGSLNFWPLAIYFPVEMYFRQKGIEPWSKAWVGLRLFSLARAILSVVHSSGLL